MASNKTYLPTGNTKWYYLLNWDATDSSGLWNNWTATNISYVDWIFWQWWSFNGSTSVISAIPNWGITTNFTCSVWIKTSSITQAAWAFIWITNQTTNGSPSFWITTFAWLTKLFFNKSYVIEIWKSNTLTVSNDIWYNFIVTYNWSAYNFYQNWINIWSWTNSQTFTTWSQMAIWRDWLTTGWYNGILDEVIIDNIPWSAKNVSDYYLNSVWKFNPIIN